MMKYEDAIKEWGARRLESGHLNGWGNPTPIVIDRSTVCVSMDFNQGYACCGGNDPDCYCSFAESPSANVEITGRTVAAEDDWGSTYTCTIDASDFDFVGVLGAIVEAGGGTVTS